MLSKSNRLYIFVIKIVMKVILSMACYVMHRDKFNLYFYLNQSNILTRLNVTY